MNTGPCSAHSRQWRNEASTNSADHHASAGIGLALAREFGRSGDELRNSIGATGVAQVVFRILPLSKDPQLLREART
jgi:hypothetical protein